MQNGKELGLPFWRMAQDVVAAARSGRGVVVMPTGTGKTTQTPQALHEAGFTKKGKILISVPRRVLAAELAARVAEEMNVPLGGLVGYRIRGEHKVSSDTKIVFMTEGMLRGAIRSNPTLEGVSVILFDEFHMRTLMSDFNVALVEHAQEKGSEVAFLLMSATMDASKLAKHFQCALVDGSHLVKMHPIMREYNPPEPFESVAEAVAREAQRLISVQEGNGIVFVPGKREISDVMEAMRRHSLHLRSDVTILPLHGELEGEARHLPFVERPGITITITTDVVETGATLPNIGWVIDTGLAREMRYDVLSDISSLLEVEVARDRLEQRAGRCGRVRPGAYIGLFSQENFINRPERTTPGIYAASLREVVLTIKALEFSREGNPLRFIDNPPKGSWQLAKRQLQGMGFVDAALEARITPLGNIAVGFGCDPREAAMLLKAQQLGCVRETAIAIAATQSHRLLVRPASADPSAVLASHQRFNTSKVCDAWAAVRVVRLAEARGEKSLREWCKENFVSYRTLQEIFTVSRQLLGDLQRTGFEISPTAVGTEEQLCAAIAAGLPDKVFTYNGAAYVQEGGLLRAQPARDSKLVARRGERVAAWQIIGIATRRGILNLITNRVVLPG